MKNYLMRFWKHSLNLLQIVFNFSGKENILYQPEFNDVDKLRRLVSAFENSKVWKTLPLSSEDGYSNQYWK